MQGNIAYLLRSFNVDYLLHDFRVRAGKPAPLGNRAPDPFWDLQLKGSAAGRFLMGAGNTLRWLEHDDLRAMMDAVIDGIEECRDNRTGWLLGFPEQEFMKNEQSDYARSWFTQGLIEAGKAGNPKAFPMLSGKYAARAIAMSITVPTGVSRPTRVEAICPCPPLLTPSKM